MRKHLIALTVGGAAAMGALAGCDPLGASEGKKTLDLVARQVDSAEIPAPNGFVGTRFVGSDDVFDGPAKVGRSVRSCEVITSAGDGTAVFQCVITLTLSSGALTFQTMPALTQTGLEATAAAVTGGTGAYNHARGQADVRELSPTELSYKIDLR